MKSTTQALDVAYRGKVATLATVLMVNDLSGYKSGNIFCKAATSLEANNLSGYINDNAGTDAVIEGRLT